MSPKPDPTRRHLLVALAATSSALTAPFISFAQAPAKVWRIGLLEPRSQSASVERVFFEGLRDLGYVEGRNLVVQRVFADNDLERLPELAAQLVKSKVDLIVTRGTPAVRAAQQATTTIPILALAFGDPVALGFAKSLARPGGNITGRTLIAEEFEGKRLELLVETVPRVIRIAYLINPDNPASIRSASDLEQAARKINKELVIVHARGEHEFNAAFAQIIRERAGAVLFALDTVFDDHLQRMGELALQHKLPSMFGVSRAGGYGILSYGMDFSLISRSAAMMADKIFRGSKAGDIPIERPSHFIFVVNLKIAKALGITVPPAVMVQATRVIE